MVPWVHSDSRWFSLQIPFTMNPIFHFLSCAITLPCSKPTFSLLGPKISITTPAALPQHHDKGGETSSTRGESRISLLCVSKIDRWRTLFLRANSHVMGEFPCLEMRRRRTVDPDCPQTHVFIDRSQSNGRDWVIGESIRLSISICNYDLSKL